MSTTNAAEAGPVVLAVEEASAQSLATGTAGVALLHVEKALTGSGDWQAARAYVRQAAAGPIDASDHAGLYYGAPAIALILHAASADGRTRYPKATRTINAHVTRLGHQRLLNAEARIHSGASTRFAEYDLFHGLVGIGALLLRYMPSSDVLRDILAYLIRLAKPRRHGGVQLPGWWVTHDPDPLLPTPGGHANLGMAHGAAGILALLALAARHGCMIDGQVEAIEQLGTWFDTWQQDPVDGFDGPWWPQWVTRDELRAGRPTQSGPGRPSWCYGAVGIARAQQLAAIVTSNPVRRKAAEDALVSSLAERQLNRLTDGGLCHGIGGVFQTAFRAAEDAHNPAIWQRLPALASALSTQATSSYGEDGGLLTGNAGIGLALETARHVRPPRSGWDVCLLLA